MHFLISVQITNHHNSLSLFADRTSMAATSFTKTMLLSLSLLALFWRVTTALQNTSSLELSNIRAVCAKTPYPDHCLESLKLSISININPNILTYVIQTLQTAIADAAKVTALLSTAGKGNNNLVERQRGTIRDCDELHQITLTCLHRSLSRVQSSQPNSRQIADARAYLSAALSNKDTCLEGLGSAAGPLKPALVGAIVGAYRHVSNSLSMLPRAGAEPSRHRRRLMAALRRRVDEYDAEDVVTVAQDGTGNFRSIGEAVSFAPNNSEDRVIIYVKSGVYEENVEIPSYKTNIVLLGDGSDVTVLTGNRSVVAGWTTFRSATLAVSGEGFLARDITIENSAGPENHQAVALRLNADFSALYRCTLNGHQDTLYVHSFRQFFRECDIFGTIDYVFGNAASVFQNCRVVSKLPLPGQFTVATAQSRETPDEDTGMSFQNCSVLATADLFAAAGKVRSFLGRPWREFARTVFLESYIDGFIDPSGWTEWSGDQGLSTLYYGEYENYGPGSGTENRVRWPGFHVMEYDDAANFTVREFITGDAWLESTSFPYDDGI